MLLRPASLALVLSLAGWGQSPSGPAGLQSADLTPLASPMAALAAPSNGVVWAGGAGGLWRQSGQGWQNAGGGAAVSAVASSADGSILYAGTGDVNDQPTRAGIGLWRSQDAGASWELAGGALAELAITRIALDPGNAQHVLVATVAAADSPSSAQPGLYASDDGGASWTQVLAGGVWDVGWSGSSVIALGASALEVSSDNGVTFAQAPASGLPDAWQRAAICPHSGGGYWALFAGAAPGGAASLLQLAGDGARATAATLPPGLGASGAAITVGSDAQGDLWVGGGDLWELPAASPQWRDVTLNTHVHAGQHALAMAPDGSLWLANDGGVWQAAPGQTPVSRNAGLANAAVLAFALTPGGVVAGMAGGGMATGGSASSSVWTLAAGPGGAGASITALAADGGDSTGQSVYAATGSQLWHSANAGSQWAAAASTPVIPGSITALAAGAGGLWVGTATGQLLVSQDGGLSFVGVAPPAGAGAISALAVAGSGAATVWLGAAGGCYESEDGGNTWAGVAGLTGAVAGLAVDPLRPAVVAAATSAGVQISLDGGGHWVDMANAGSLPTAPVTGLALDGKETLWLATLGQGMWSWPLAGAGVQLTLAANPGSAPSGSTVSLQAKVTALAQPLAGVAVTFYAGGPSPGWSATAVSDAQGQATASYTLPTTAGTVAWAAAASGAAGTVTANATLTATPGPAATLIVVSGANQAQVGGQLLAQPIVLEVVDRFGNPIANTAVGLSASEGSFGAASITTDSQGRASASYTLPTGSGAAILTAHAGSLSQSWSEVALSAPDYVLTLTAPSVGAAPNQTANLTVAMAGTGGYSGTVALHCAAPAVGCSVAPANLAPGQTAVVAVAVGAAEANQASVQVEVAGDGGHSASASLPLEAFTLAASAAAVSVQAGGAPATIGLQAAPLNGLTGAVTLAATLADGSPLPATLVPLFQPSGLAFGANGAPVSAQLIVTVAGSQAGAPWTLLGLWLVGAGWAARRRRRWGWLAGWVALAAAGCGGAAPAAPDPPPAVAAPAASYALLITATASGLQASAPVTLTVTAP